MKNSNRMARATAIAVIVFMTTTIVFSTLPAYAQYTKMPDRDTQTEVAVSPTLVGMGQSVIVNIMTYPAPNGPTYEAQSLVPSLTGGFANISVTFNHPDGTKETFMPTDMTLAQIGIIKPGQAQIVGHLQFSYTPTKLGNYTVTASFPGQTYTTDNQHPTIKISVYYKPSASTIPCKFNVQQELVLAGQLNGYPWSPLPKSFWRDPVSTDNREWAAISGDWVQQAYNEQATNYNPYSTAPNTPHILWSRQVAQSGLPGGEWGSLAYGTGGSSDIILDGKFYQSSRSGYFECRDLYTGQRLWEAEGSISRAARIDPAYQTASQLNEGSISAWLWAVSGSNWIRYNSYTGAVMQNITGAPTDTTSTKWENNSPIVWVNQASLSSYNKTKPLKLGYSYLIKWNYSKVTGNNWKTGIMWNVSTQTSNSPTDIDVGDNFFRGPTCVPYPAANVVLVRTPNAMQVMEGLDYTTGRLLWKNNATVFDIDVRAEGIATSPTGPNMKQDGATPNYVAYDVTTGRELWRAPSGEVPWGLLPAYTFVYNNGVFFHGSYDGHVYADRISDGKSVWVSDYIGQEFEAIYNNQPFNGKAAGADGKLYYSTATTYSMQPRLRFTRTVCINETTGKFIWNLPIGIAPSAIANGYVLGTDSDNGIQYCIGKGQTATTVETPLTGISVGTSVVIKGAVTDLSPGAPNTPAISDADMSEWMDYLYGQNATLLNNPPTPKGVTVRLSAMAADGTVIDIGTVTSDSSGMFKKMWTPTTEGEYTVFATFDGSESYYGSYAESALGVVKAPADSSTTQPQQTVPDYSMTIIGVGIAIMAVVVLSVAVAIVMLKKR